MGNCRAGQATHTSANEDASTPSVLSPQAGSTPLLQLLLHVELRRGPSHAPRWPCILQP